MDPIPHQANIRIINAAIDVLHIDRAKVFNNLDRYGNTAGSILRCRLCRRAVASLHRGHEGFGAGRGGPRWW